jgi:hypothetical protein
MDNNFKSRNKWVRLLYMLLFVLIYNLAEIILFFVVLFQFVNTLISDEPNETLLDFGQRLATFIYQIVLFWTYRSEEKPFPFSPWPSGEPR